MQDYDPMSAPDAEAWLALDEQERINLVERQHRLAGVQLPAPRLHAVLHSVVETQLASDEPEVHAALERLRQGGLDRHEALHAVASVVAEHIQTLFAQSDSGDKGLEAYHRKLRALTVESWQAQG